MNIENTHRDYSEPGEPLALSEVEGEESFFR